MIRQMFMALLALALALPALAAPLDHASPLAAPVAAAHGHHDHHSSPASPATPGHKGKHECIGCIVVLNTPPSQPVILDPLATPGLVLVAVRAPWEGKPDTPPPKA